MLQVSRTDRLQRVPSEDKAMFTGKHGPFYPVLRALYQLILKGRGSEVKVQPCQPCGKAQDS